MTGLRLGVSRILVWSALEQASGVIIIIIVLHLQASLSSETGHIHCLFLI